MFTTTKNKIIVALIVAALIAVGVLYVKHSNTVKVGSIGGQLIEDNNPYYRNNGGLNTALPIQTSSTISAAGVTNTGNESVSGNLTVAGDVIFTSTLTTTTPSSLTLQASDIGYENIVMTPTGGSITVTLPATSTITSLIPNSGNSTSIFWLNATTTASQNITVNAGTGFNCAIASSTQTTGVVIKPKHAALFRLIRQPNTDISCFVSAEYQ